MVKTLSPVAIAMVVCVKVNIKFYSPQIKLKDNTDVCEFLFILQCNVLITEQYGGF
jgi:hypothetical protein